MQHGLVQVGVTSCGSARGSGVVGQGLAWGWDLPHSWSRGWRNECHSSVRGLAALHYGSVQGMGGKFAVAWGRGG